MGQAAGEKTNHIIRSLLALGLLEEGELSTGELEEKLTQFGINENVQVQRLLNHIQSWIDETTNYALNCNQVGRERRYRFDVLMENYDGVYYDFVDTFLRLFHIGDFQGDESIQRIVNKQGIQPMALLAKIGIAIKGNQPINLFLKNHGTVASFIPFKFFKSNDYWYVKGKISKLSVLYKIEEIIDII